MNIFDIKADKIRHTNKNWFSFIFLNFLNFILQNRSQLFHHFNPLTPRRTQVSPSFHRNFNSILRRDHQKNVQWASRLWVGRRKEPIFGYVLKNDEKKKNLLKENENFQITLMQRKFYQIITKNRSSLKILVGYSFPNWLGNISSIKFYKRKHPTK